MLDLFTPSAHGTDARNCVTPHLRPCVVRMESLVWEIHITLHKDTNGLD